MDNSENLEQRRHRELRERLINFYMNQYNIIHQRIESQYELLAEITSHINYLYDNNYMTNRNLFTNTNNLFNSNTFTLPNTLLDLRSRTRNDINLTEDFLDPIIVRPTQQQIEQATTFYIFSEIENPINTICPIRSQDFEPNDQVMQINRCKHNFYPSELNQWFSINTKCPVCRFDIRDNSNIVVEPSRQDIELARLLISLINLPQNQNE